MEILHQERRGQVKITVMEHISGILFHKSGPASKKHVNQSVIFYYFPLIRRLAQFHLQILIFNLVVSTVSLAKRSVFSTLRGCRVDPQRFRLNKFPK